MHHHMGGMVNIDMASNCRCFGLPMSTVGATGTTVAVTGAAMGVGSSRGASLYRRFMSQQTHWLSQLDDPPLVRFRDVQFSLSLVKEGKNSFLLNLGGLNLRGCFRGSSEPITLG